MTEKRHSLLLSVLALSGLALVGCSASFSVGGGDTIGKDQIAKKAGAKLSPVVAAQGLAPLPPISCPHDLDSKVGERMTCTATGDFGDGLHGTVDVTVRVTSVDDSGGNLHFHVNTLGKEAIAQEAKVKLDPVVEANGNPPLPPVTCPSDLYLIVGATAHCSAAGNFGHGLAGTLAVTGTITSVNGSDANLHFATANRVK